MGTECIYCGEDIFGDDPLFVAELGREVTKQDKLFCNYTCLAAFIEEEGLADSLSCDVG